MQFRYFAAHLDLIYALRAADFAARIDGALQSVDRLSTIEHAQQFPAENGVDEVIGRGTQCAEVAQVARALRTAGRRRLFTHCRPCLVQFASSYCEVFWGLLQRAPKASRN